jgi:hypothetical protein
MMKKMICALSVCLLAGATHAAVIYDFSTVRFAASGSVSGGTTNTSFTFDSKADNSTAAHSAVFTLTDDFDGDSILDSFSFTLIASTTNGVANSNTGGYVGVGNPRFENDEELTYSISLPSSVTLSGGGTGTVSFDGFTGGSMTGGTTYNYLINTVAFTDTAFTAANTATMVINANGQTDDIWSPGINFSMTVVPEPATIGMLGLGALITLLIRRHTRH